MRRALVKRKTRRRRNHTGWIILQDGYTRLECRVVDVSTDGAQITCSKADFLPNRFVLTYTLTASKRWTCEVVWRQGRTLGIKYTDAPKPSRHGAEANAAEIEPVA